MLHQAEMAANVHSEQHFPSTIIGSSTFSFIKVQSAEGCVTKRISDSTSFA